MTTEMPPFDSIILVSFGGPEGPDDVLPFLENVLRGKPVPRERMLEVAEHYQHFGGVSPINDKNRQLLDAMKEELTAAGIDLPIYWGNRNWHPMLPTTQQMKDDGKETGFSPACSVATVDVVTTEKISRQHRNRSDLAPIGKR